MIKVNSLNKFYNKGKSNSIHVINDTTLVFPETGFVTFLGNSGSGKTTLLNVIGGLDKAHGTIEYEDTVINGYKSSTIDKYRNKNIGYVFQNYNLLKEETVYENLRLALEFIGINDTEEVNKRIKTSLESVSMYKYRKRLAGALSGGQQQRISIARALVKDAKVIIADEPTGNLDSTNSIAVMNILKELSKTKLVLLVTHDKEYAKFYSDRVLGIKDGSVIHDFTNESGVSSINTKDDRVVYLGDLEEEALKTSGLSISTYKDEDTNAKAIDLKVVYVNGVFYIDSSTNLKVVKDSTDVKISESKYKPYSKEDQEAFVYDTSDFNPTITKKKFSIKQFFKALYQSFLRFRHVGILSKLLNLSLALVGLVIAIMFIIYSYSTNIDFTEVTYAKDYDSVSVFNEDFSSYSYIRDNSSRFASSLLKDDNLVDFISGTTSISLDTAVNGSLENGNSVLFGSSNSVSVEGYMIRSSFIDKGDIIAGSLPLNYNEIVLDKRIVTGLQSKVDTKIDLTYDFLIGSTIVLRGKSYLVSGISNTDSSAVYLNDVNYYYSSIYDYNNFPKFQNLRFKQDSSYEIFLGRDINLLESDKIEVVVSSAYTKRFDISLGDHIDNINTVIVGIVESDIPFTIVDKNYADKSTYKSTLSELSNHSEYYYMGEYISDATALVKGNAPTLSNEVVVSKYLGLEIGDKIDIRIQEAYGNTVSTLFTVSGLTDSKVTDLYLFTRNIYLSNIIFTSDYIFDPIFKINDRELLNENFALANLDMKSIDSKGSTVVELTDTKMNDNKGFLIACGVLLGVIIIYIYFIMRSKMLKQIYTIGVYRALGAKKTNIYKMFLSDIFVTTTLTTFLGYIIVVIGYNKIMGSLVRTLSIYKVHTSYMLIGVLGLYVVNFIFGLLPIFLLLIKSPSEIISKYDI